MWLGFESRAWEINQGPDLLTRCSLREDFTSPQLEVTSLSFNSGIVYKAVVI